MSLVHHEQLHYSAFKCVLCQRPRILRRAVGYDDWSVCLVCSPKYRWIFVLDKFVLQATHHLRRDPHDDRELYLFHCVFVLEHNYVFVGTSHLRLGCTSRDSSPLRCGCNTVRAPNRIVCGIRLDDGTWYGVRPGMAIVLDHLDFEFTLPILGKQYFNGIKGPGYFMSLAWSSYTPGDHDL